MKKIHYLLCLLFISLPVWGQQFSDEDQYPESDPAIVDESEFSAQRGLPSTDYEEVPREEQEYSPNEPAPVTEDLAAPEDIYEADEEYLE